MAVEKAGNKVPTAKIVKEVVNRLKSKKTRGKRNKWNNSKKYLKTAAKKRELELKKTAYVKSQNRKIVNEILRHGRQIKTENVSVKGWQKRYGKTIAAKSPGFVQSELKRKAESAGGSFQKFSTRKTALSQTHLDGSRISKSLSQRVHRDNSGFKMHRDLLHDARQEYQRSESILRCGMHWAAFISDFKSEIRPVSMASLSNKLRTSRRVRK